MNTVYATHAGKVGTGWDGNGTGTGNRAMFRSRPRFPGRSCRSFLFPPCTIPRKVSCSRSFVMCLVPVPSVSCPIACPVVPIPSRGSHTAVSPTPYLPVCPVISIPFTAHFLSLFHRTTMHGCNWTGSCNVGGYHTSTAVHVIFLPCVFLFLVLRPFYCLVLGHLL